MPDASYKKHLKSANCNFKHFDAAVMFGGINNTTDEFLEHLKGGICFSWNL